MTTLKTLLLLTAFNLLTMTSQATNPLFQTITNPILPIQLGPTKLIESTHKFLYQINTLTILEYADNLYQTYEKLNSTTYDLPPLVEFTLAKVAQKLSSLPSNKHSKRGLVDGIGKISKFLFGTLTEDDKKDIIKRYEILNENQHKLETQLKTQLSILQPLAKVFNETISTLSENQQEIANQVKNLKNDFRESNARFIGQQIIDNANSLLTLIDEIYIAISFSALKTVYNPIVSLKEVSFMKNTLSQIYGNSKLLPLENDLSYFKLMHQDVFFKYPNFNFIITLPLFSSENLFLYKIYPIPQANVTLIPYKPIIMLGEKNQQYLDEECPQVENYYICDKKPQPIQDDCISTIIHGQQPSDCQFSKVKVIQPIVYQVGPNQLLAIPFKESSIRFQCDTNGVERIQSPTLITIDPNCKLWIDDEPYLLSSNPTTVIGTGILLPPLQKEVNVSNVISHDINLKTVHFEDINRIIQSSHSLSSVSTIESLPEEKFTIFWILFTLTLILLGLLMFYLGFQKKILSFIRSRRSQENPNSNDVPMVSSGPHVPF